MAKFKMDKFISDYSGVSEAHHTSKNMSGFLGELSKIIDSRKNDTVQVMDYVYGLQANSTDTYGFNEYHNSPCNFTQFKNIP